MSRVFFTDRDLGRIIPDTLREAGLQVERHADHFAHDAPDDEWLTAVGGKGWIVLSHDQRIRYKTNERDAVVRARVSLIVLLGKVAHRELGSNVVTSIAQIIRYLDSHPAPCIGKLYLPSVAERRRNPSAPGRVEHWYP